MNEYGHASGWSDPATFTVTVTPPASLTLKTATGNPPTFNWNAVTNAEEYNLKISSTLGVEASVASSASQICDSASCTATLSATLTEGLYTWYVTAFNSGGSFTSDTATFTVGTATWTTAPIDDFGTETVAVLTGADYVYNGDGEMVKSIVNDVVTYYAGKHYNRVVNGAVITVQKTYMIGSQVVAVETAGVLQFVITDHLGSIYAMTDSSGTLVSRMRYTAFGERRSEGVDGAPQTKYRYTSQLEQAEVGLYFYNARFSFLS